MKNTWQISLTVLFLSLIVSLIVMFFIKTCGSCLVFSIIVVYFIILITFGVLCYEEANHNIDIDEFDYIGDADTLRTMGTIVFVLAGLSLIVVACTFRRIRTGIMIVKTAATFVNEECQTILVPVFMFVSIVIVLIT